MLAEEALHICQQPVMCSDSPFDLEQHRAQAEHAQEFGVVSAANDAFRAILVQLLKCQMTALQWQLRCCGSLAQLVAPLAVSCPAQMSTAI
jgi:hypothetical protein